MTYWYLATPYAHPERKVRAARAIAAGRLCSKMLSEGRPTFSPVAHGHMVRDLVPDWTHTEWLAFDELFLRPAAGLIFCMMPGWQESKGMDWEYKWATAHKKPVLWLKVIDCQNILGPKLWRACHG